MERPSMRNLTLSPYMPPEQRLQNADGEEQKPQHFLLEDPEGFAPPLVLPIPLAILISMMDGHRTMQEILEEFTQTTNEPMEMKDLEEMVAYLDRLHYLDGPNFEKFLRNEKNSYAREKYRPAAMAGGAYPKTAKELRKMISGILELPRKISKAEDPEKKFKTYFPEKICGAVSTHVEPERGGLSYGWTFQAIAEHSDADVFLILGTSHNPMQEKFAFSSKDFDTPLGVLPTDHAFQKRVSKKFMEKYAELEDQESREAVDLFGDDFVHRDEHSIEFQAIFLKYLAETQKREIRIVPILVNSFLPFFAARDVEYPDENDVVRLFIESLADVIREDETAGNAKYFVMASSDLAHLGPMYDTPQPVDAERQDQIRQTDMEVLETVVKPDSRGFWQNILGSFNANKICGVAPIYCTLRLLEYLGRGTDGKLLSYEQTVDEETHSCVSFASIVLKHQD